MEYSVVICSYNKVRHLKTVVESLRAIGGWKELILSDDHSGDGTLEWAACGVFTKMVLQPEHKDFCLNTVRNQGVAAARCSHVVLLDADCVPQPGYFEAHNKVFEMFGDCLSVGVTDCHDENGEAGISKDHRRGWLSGGGPVEISWHGAYGGNIAFPVALWKKVGKFDEAYNGCWGFEDLDFSFRANKLGYRCFMHEGALARHCRHPARHDNAPVNRNSRLFQVKNGFPP